MTADYTLEVRFHPLYDFDLDTAAAVLRGQAEERALAWTAWGGGRAGSQEWVTVTWRAEDDEAALITARALFDSVRAVIGGTIRRVDVTTADGWMNTRTLLLHETT